MKMIMLALTLALAAQGPNPDNPFPGHEMPPEGWFCSTFAKEPAHQCDCVRMNHGPNCEPEYTMEDPRCKVACHKDHCHCDVRCDS